MSFLISKDEQQLGPFTADEVNSQLAGGMMDPSDLCWSEGFDDWYPLNQIEGFVMPGTQVVPTTEAEPATAAATELASGDSALGLVTAGASDFRFGGRKKWFIGGGIVAVLLATGAFLVFGGAGLDGLCQELAEVNPETGLPIELESKVHSIRVEAGKVLADDNKTEAINRLNKALNILKTGS